MDLRETHTAVRDRPAGQIRVALLEDCELVSLGLRAMLEPHADRVDLVEPDHVLAGVAPAVWLAADAASVSDLALAAIDAYGRPAGDVDALVGAAADELVDAGVLSTERG